MSQSADYDQNCRLDRQNSNENIQETNSRLGSTYQREITVKKQSIIFSGQGVSMNS